VRIKRLLTIGCVAFLAGCTKPANRTIYIDGWWDFDYANNVCAVIEKSNGNRCVFAGADYARQLEVAFTSAVQTNPACGGLKILNDYHDPKTDGATTKLAAAGWSLSFNTDIENGELNAKGSMWQIIDHKTLKRFAEGDMGDAYEASTRVCTMVKGQGGEQQ
jgi:hypothetical protein